MCSSWRASWSSVAAQLWPSRKACESRGLPEGPLLLSQEERLGLQFKDAVAAAGAARVSRWLRCVPGERQASRAAMEHALAAETFPEGHRDRFF